MFNIIGFIFPSPWHTVHVRVGPDLPGAVLWPVPLQKVQVIFSVGFIHHGIWHIFHLFVCVLYYEVTLESYFSQY